MVGRVDVRVQDTPDVTTGDDVRGVMVLVGPSQSHEGSRLSVLRSLPVTLDVDSVVDRILVTPEGGPRPRLLMVSLLHWTVSSSCGCLVDIDDAVGGSFLIFFSLLLSAKVGT